MKRQFTLVEFFAGSCTVSKVARSMGFKTFAVDVKPFPGVDLVENIDFVELSDLPVADVVWASPPCTYFSVASIGTHWTPEHAPKTARADVGVRWVEHTLALVDAMRAKNPHLKYFFENPRGKLRKLPVMAGRPRKTVTYCSYGDSRMKPTDIWSNFFRSFFNPDGWQPREVCRNRRNVACSHDAAPRGSKTGTQGLASNYERSMLPEELAREILTACLKELKKNETASGPRQRYHRSVT